MMKQVVMICAILSAVTARIQGQDLGGDDGYGPLREYTLLDDRYATPTTSSSQPADGQRFSSAGDEQYTDVEASKARDQQPRPPLLSQFSTSMPISNDKSSEPAKTTTTTTGPPEPPAPLPPPPPSPPRQTSVYVYSQRKYPAPDADPDNPATQPSPTNQSESPPRPAVVYPQPTTTTTPATTVQPVYLPPETTTRRTPYYSAKKPLPPVYQAPQTVPSLYYYSPTEPKKKTPSVSGGHRPHRPSSQDVMANVPYVPTMDFVTNFYSAAEEDEPTTEDDDVIEFSVPGVGQPGEGGFIIPWLLPSLIQTALNNALRAGL